MKRCLFFVLFLPGQHSNSAFTSPASGNSVRAGLPPDKQQLYYWTGFIKDRIPVFMWIAVKDSVVQGELTYTKSKAHVPIRVLGFLTGDKQDGVRICEYQADGTITGILTFNQLSDTMGGTWFSPEKQQELICLMTHKDTTVANIDTGFAPRRIPGTYSYAYGKEGAEGDMEVKQISVHKISFSVNSVTSAPAHNLATAGPDTVNIYNNQFFYSMPEAKNCRFKIVFFRDFVYIRQVNYDDCAAVFGMSASIEGVFIRTSK